MTRVTQFQVTPASEAKRPPVSAKR